MKHISIHDHENNRVIWAQVPTYLTDTGASNEDIAQAIFDALGISSSNTEYMMGDMEHVLADHNADSSREERGIELLTQEFKQDALASLEASKN